MEQLRNYVAPKSKPIFVSMIVLAVAVLAAYLTDAFKLTTTTRDSVILVAVFVIWIALICAITFLIHYLIAKSYARKAFKTITDRHAEDAAENDFNTALHINHFKGKKQDVLRLGNRYLFARGQGIIIEYSDVIRVYQRIRRTYAVETSRSVVVRTRDNKNYSVYDLASSGKGDKDLTAIVKYMLSKNPAIEVGYKR